ncbi:helix-turn-helix transcriptional regulator [Dactylosporangium sp. NPDC051485]|uniref:helix-turn-helix domain-containing protein n=1 Tax=Dactylosporangium sp. NPDC051485 TaxID=3154846 RepID=UPI00342628CD
MSILAQPAPGLAGQRFRVGAAIDPKSDGNRHAIGLRGTGMSFERRDRALRIGLLIRAARKRKGWSQYRLNLRLRELGEAYGFGSATYDSIKVEISRWENGHRIPDQRSRRLLALALGVRAEDLGLPLDPLDDWPT